MENFATAGKQQKRGDKQTRKDKIKKKNSTNIALRVRTLNVATKAKKEER